MVHRLHELDVRIELEMPVADILLQEGRVAGVRTKSGAHYKADAVILAVGGASYPGTGSTGDGYEMAKKLGHTVVPLRPSLVPLETEEEWVKDVQGLSLRNVRATLLAGGEKVQEMFGEMMFTHFGVTGPIILSMSRRAAKCLAEGKFVELELNLKPALTPEKLDARIQRDFEQHIRKSLKNGLLELLPHTLIEPVLDCAYLDPEKPVHQVTAEERHRLAETLQHLTLTIAKTRPLAEAIVTAGGVSVREINPKTMESKLVPGFYFAGEVVDVDAYTGATTCRRPSPWAMRPAAGASGTTIDALLKYD